MTLRARQIVEGYVAGLHRSPYRGFSIEFAEHREYAPGDDLRYVDWKVYGRTDKFYLKQHEDETNLICYLLVDVSESMLFRGAAEGLSKYDYATALAASVAWLVVQQQDAVGLATFDQQIRDWVRPASSPEQLRPILQCLERGPGPAKSRLGPVFQELAERCARRGVVVIVSDLFDDLDSVVAGLRHFRHRRHDVLLVHLLDAAELEFPFEELTLFQGLEQGPEVLADPLALRAAYLAELERWRQGMRSAVQSLGVNYHLLRTDVPFDTALASLLAKRETRVA